MTWNIHPQADKRFGALRFDGNGAGGERWHFPDGYIGAWCSTRRIVWRKKMANHTEYFRKISQFDAWGTARAILLSSDPHIL